MLKPLALCSLSFSLIFTTGSALAFDMGDKAKSRQGEGMSGGHSSQKMMKARAFIPPKATRDAMARFGFITTGLKPVYPTRYDCPKVLSVFASPTRSDGSRRSQRFFKGLHGGFDIPQPQGTPLLAMADGELIIKHEGMEGGIGGKGIWMRHSPAQTGLDKWLFIEYKHLDTLPDFEPGTTVKLGQQVGTTGNSGTTGGHYGANGFYHLHMTAYWSESPEYRFNKVLIPKRGQWLDPLALFKDGELDSAVLEALPPTDRQVSIHFMTIDGHIVPEQARIIWPYACQPAS
ncbi:MAG: peptidoglycan DD-metalloendopeptidase family protein [Oceanospirillaceae bacterium]|nr:peptidoglycan DD-metalloendopeptidase family protein [Oceanospirillaceae bacterium]